MDTSWQGKDNSLNKTFQFDSPAETWQFMSGVNEETTKANLFPRITLERNVVDIAMPSNNESYLQLANKIDIIFNSQQMDMEKKDAKKATYIDELKIYADGGSRGNPGPSASGFVIYDMDDKILHKEGVYLGVTTNNQAEYQAIRFGLERIREYHPKHVHIFMDSLLVINQLKGVFKVKNRDLWPVYSAVKNLLELFEEVELTHVPRELNKAADTEVNECLDAATK